LLTSTPFLVNFPLFSKCKICLYWQRQEQTTLLACMSILRLLCSKSSLYKPCNAIFIMLYQLKCEWTMSTVYRRWCHTLFWLAVSGDSICYIADFGSSSHTSGRRYKGYKEAALTLSCLSVPSSPGFRGIARHFSLMI
jgi:hypothetical protein